MLKRAMVLAVVLGLVAGAFPAQAAPLDATTSLNGGTNAIPLAVGTQNVDDNASGVYDWNDKNGDGTPGDAVTPAGLNLGTYMLYTNDGTKTVTATAIKLDLNGGNITGQGVWNAVTSRFDAITTERTSFYPTYTGDIVIKNVGDISCGSITTHAYFQAESGCAAGNIYIGEANGTGYGEAGNIRVDNLDAENSRGPTSGSNVRVYSTGSVKIQNQDADLGATLGTVSSSKAGRYPGYIRIYHEGAFRAGDLLARTGTSTYGADDHGGEITLDGDYDNDTVGTPLGDCEINNIDASYKRNGYGNPNDKVKIENYASVTINGYIDGHNNGPQSDCEATDVTIQGVAGDITIGGAINLWARNSASDYGDLKLYTTSGSGGSVALDGGLDCGKVKFAALDSDSGTSTIGGSLLGFDTVTRIKLRTPSGDVIKYDPFDGGNAYLGVLSYVVADLSGAAGIGGTLIPDVASRTWDGGTSGTWDADGFDDSGADAPTTATEMAKFESGATTKTVLVAAGSGAGPVAGIVRIDGGSAYTFSDSGGALGLGAGGGTAYIIVADTGAAHVIDANVTLNCGTYIDMQQAGGTLTVNGDISGSETLTKIGSGTVTLSGSNSHSATVVDAGTLVCGAVDTLPSGGAVTVNGGTLDAGANNQDLGAGVLMISGGTVNGTATISSSSAFDARSGTVNAVLGGTGGLNKTTSGTVSLGGTNTYTGPTAVTAGRLNVNGSTAAASTVTVSGTGVLGGTGTINGSLIVNSGGTVAPGTSVGALNGVNATWGAGGVYDWEIDHATAGAGTGWDLLNLSGTLDIAATSADPFTVNLFTVGSLGGSHPADSGDMANFDKDSSHSWKIASAAGGVTGFDADDFVLDYREFRNAYDGNLMAGFGIRQDGNDVYVDYTPQKLLDIRIDFGGSLVPGWNVLPARTTGTTLALLTTDGLASDLKLEITNGFASAGTGDGWSGNNVPFWLPWSASDDEFYEGSTGEVGEITITGLVPGLTYYFELIASMDGMTYWRADYLLNDEFSIDGNSDDFYNDTEGHRDHDIMLWTFVADGSGQAVLEMTVRSYVSGMNALRITVEPPALAPIPEPAALGLVGMALLALRRRRR